jgi:hypothetical protein
MMVILKILMMVFILYTDTVMISILLCILNELLFMLFIYYKAYFV